MRHEQSSQRNRLLREAMQKTYGTAVLQSKSFDANNLFSEEPEQAEVVVSLGLVILWTVFLLVSFFAIHLFLTTAPDTTERFQIDGTQDAYVLVDNQSGRRWQLDSAGQSPEWVAADNEEPQHF